MSVRQMGEVWRRWTESPGERLILLRLADCANDEGENVYPSRQLLEDETGLGERQTDTIMASLRKRGVLEPVGRRGKRWAYRLHLDQLPLLIEVERKRNPRGGKRKNPAAVVQVQISEDCNHCSDAQTAVIAVTQTADIAAIGLQSLQSSHCNDCSDPYINRTEPSLEPSVEPPTGARPNGLSADEVFAGKFWPIYGKLNGEGKNFARTRFRELVTSGETTAEYLVSQVQAFSTHCQRIGLTKRGAVPKAIFWLGGGDWEIDYSKIPDHPGSNTETLQEKKERLMRERGAA